MVTLETIGSSPYISPVTESGPIGYEVTVGDYYNQDQIEEIFDTGFGYQITGINVRRDDADQRYILLFAKEDGPYDDDVRKGRFEYIGEGLSGDQSASSLGNSALIAAVATSVPIYFFYKDATDERWEYQGLVAVHDYRIKEHNGRGVLVFKMEHTEDQSNAAYPLPDGVTAYGDTLEQMLLYIESNEPSYDELLQWFFRTFDLSGEGYVKRGVSLDVSVDLVLVGRCSDLLHLVVELEGNDLLLPFCDEHLDISGRDEPNR